MGCVVYIYVLECGLAEVPLTEDVVGKIVSPSAATRVGMSVADRVSVLMQLNGIIIPQTEPVQRSLICLQTLQYLV